MDQDLIEVFDQNFYNDYYWCNSNIHEYWKDERHNGRYVHPCIIQDNFDYGLFISKCNWINNLNITTEYAAINHFLRNRLDFLQWFDTPSYKISKNQNHDKSDVCAIYVASLFSQEDLEIALGSLPKVFETTPNVYIILFGEENYCNKLQQKYIENTQEPTPYLLKKISNYKYYLYINNDIYIHKHLKDFINTAIYYNSDIFTTNDRYNIEYQDKYYYGINTDFMFIKNTISRDIFKIFYRYFDNFDFHINLYLIKKKIGFQSLFYNILEKEKFWNNLFAFNVLDHKNIVDKYSIPIISNKLHQIKNQNSAHCIIKSSIMQHSGTSLVDKIDNYATSTDSDNLSNIVCHFHIGNTNPKYIDEAKTYIDKIRNFNIDIYVTSHENISDINSYILPNIGADIGPFLYMCQKYFLNNPKYTTILKLHSKTHHGYRHLNFDTLIYHLKYIDYIFRNKYSCGLAGCLSNVCKMDEINTDIIKNFCEINRLHYDDNYHFFAGSMFVCKIDMLKNFIKQYNINLLDEYWSLEYGYKKNHEPTYTHSWERILTGIIPHPRVTNYEKIYV